MLVVSIVESAGDIVIEVIQVSYRNTGKEPSLSVVKDEGQWQE